MYQTQHLYVIIFKIIYIVSSKQKLNFPTILILNLLTNNCSQIVQFLS